MVKGALFSKNVKDRHKGETIGGGNGGKFSVGGMTPKISGGS